MRDGLMGERQRLVVFSDDWGRHPSSCQHLVSRVVKSAETIWVNTIGTRMPHLSITDFKKTVAKFRQWRRQDRDTHHADLTVVSPKMFPGFRRRWQRHFNARSMSKAVNEALGPRDGKESRIAITTLPITAGLSDVRYHLDVDRWVYYCVDDFAEWPGLDSAVMRQMEAEQLARMDVVIAASEHLRSRLGELGGHDIALLTHGIDLAHWAGAPCQRAESQHLSLFENSGPSVVFWGLIDRRLDEDWCRELALCLQRVDGTFHLVGPIEHSPDFVKDFPKTVTLSGAIPYADLPLLADKASVLVMPYRDMPVTRAMQPLKFKEYLATGKPVVARALPATMEWQTAADLVHDSNEFCQRVIERIKSGATELQRTTRQQLDAESWDEKARGFAAMIGLRLKADSLENSREENSRETV